MHTLESERERYKFDVVALRPIRWRPNASPCSRIVKAPDTMGFYLSFGPLP